MTLIDKEALLEKLSTFHPDYTFNITSFRNFIKAQPEAEKKGKWIMIDDHTARCSSCNEIRWTNGHDQTMKGHIFYGIYKYCPDCGARMEEEK